MPVSHGNVRSLRRLPTPVHRKVNKVGNCKSKLRLLALKISPKSIERRLSRGPGGLQALTCTNTKAKLWCRALTNPLFHTPQSGPPTTTLVAPARNGGEISRKFDVFRDSGGGGGRDAVYARLPACPRRCPRS